MKNWVKGAMVAMVVVPAMAMAQQDQSCYGLRYSLDFLSVYPEAPALCQEVKEQDGIKYARLDARVVSRSKDYVTVGFKDVFGNKLNDLEIQAVKGSTVSVGGKTVAWSDVKVGDQLSFWLPERSLHVLPQPGGEGGAPIVFRSKAK